MLEAIEDDEPIEVLTPSGKPTGLAKPRELVHREGDWHRVFVLHFFERKTPKVYLYLQRRSREKRTAPGMWDAAVAGHYRLGEDQKAVIREVKEELGLTVEEHSLFFLGTRINWGDDVKSGVLNREFQDVYLAEMQGMLERVKPDYREVEAFVCAEAGALRNVLDPRIVKCDRFTAPGVRVTHKGIEAEEFEIMGKDFWSSFDHHYLKVALLVESYAKGETLPSDPFSFEYFALERLLLK